MGIDYDSVLIYGWALNNETLNHIKCDNVEYLIYEEPEEFIKLIENEFNVNLEGSHLIYTEPMYDCRLRNLNLFISLVPKTKRTTFEEISKAKENTKLISECKKFIRLLEERIIKKHDIDIEIIEKEPEIISSYRVY